MQSPEQSHGGGHEHLDEGLVHAWLDGQLPADEGRAIEARAAECAECAAVVAEARGLTAAATRIIGALDTEAATPAMRDASLERTRALVRETPDAESPRAALAPGVVPIASARRRRRWAVPATIAATLLVGALSLLNDRERAGRSVFELKSVADESGARATVASAPPPSAAPMPMVVSPRGIPPTDSASAGRGLARQRGAGGDVGAEAANRAVRPEPQRAMAPAEQARVAESSPASPAPAVAPPAAPVAQRSAFVDTVAARVAADRAVATARRDSASGVRPLESVEVFRGDRREHAKAAAAPARAADLADARRVTVTGADATTAVPSCYVVERGVAGLPAAFVLDTGAVSAPAGRAAYRVRSGSTPGEGPEVGSWSPLAPGSVSILLRGAGAASGGRLGTLGATPIGGVAQVPLRPDSATVEIYRGTRSAPSRVLPPARTGAGGAAAAADTVAVRRVECRH